MLAAFSKWNERFEQQLAFTSQSVPRIVAAVTIAALIGLASRIEAQSVTATDVARQLSGRWKLNKELVIEATAGDAVFGEPRGEWL
jgi:hypothetical protein